MKWSQFVTISVITALSYLAATYFQSRGLSIALALLGPVAVIWAGSRLYSQIVDDRASKSILEKQVEEANALAVRERNVLDGLVEGLDVWILLLDRQGQIQYANEEAIKAVGFKNPLGQSVLAVTLSRELADLVEASAAGQATEMVELTLRHPQERIVMARVWPANDQGDQFFLSVYDVTDLRRLERARRDFVANVSHELRTPMATIRAMAETILDEPQPEDSPNTRYLQKVITEVDRLTRISDDLLILSAAESDSKHKEPVELAQVVHAALVQARPKTERKGLELKEGALDPAVVMGNAEQLTQVMLNLLENAINYTANGSIEVSCIAKDGFATVSVKDSGMGIPSDHLARVFERFYRVDKARSRATGGTGLGLSIVRNIIESHGGTVGVESVLNSGSTFWFRIPILEDE